MQSQNTIVMLPGMDGSGLLFSDFIASVSPNTESVVVSYPPDQALDYLQLERFVSDRMPSHPFVLLAESFSGPIAISLAAGGLSGLRGLVLVGSFAQSPIQAPYVLRRLLISVPIWRVPVAVTASLLFGRWSTARARVGLSAAISGVTAAAWRARLLAVMSVDVTDKLYRIEVPVLLLRGKSDLLVPRSAADVVSKYVSSAQLIELDGPHAILQTKPSEAAAKVTEFARSLEAEY